MRVNFFAVWLLVGLSVPGEVRSLLVPQPQPAQQQSLTRINTCQDGRLRFFFQPSPSTSGCRNWHRTQPALLTLHQKLQDNESGDERPNSRRGLVARGRAILRRIKKPLIPFAISLFFALSVRANPAEAKFSHELTNAPTHSLRPGMTRSDAEDVIEGRVDIEDLQQGSPEQAAPAAPKAKVSQSIYGTDFEDDEDDFHLDDDETDAYFQSRSSRRASQAEQTFAQNLQATQTAQFSSYQKEKTPMLFIKVGAGLFVPTFGTMFVREHFRQVKEEAYVQKGLEIMEAQKAEYFNVTNTSADADVEDELKGLKNNSTDNDSDDDTDDDGDSEDDDEDDYRRRPRRPRGGGDDGDSGSGGGAGFDAGDGEASDEDKKRLKDLFDKS